MMRKIFLTELFLLFCATGFVPRSTYSQTYFIKGNISTFNEPVRNAQITFINNADSLKKYSAITDASGNYQLNIITSVKNQEVALPTKFELSQNYPNPFSNETEITYKLSKPADVSVKIYNVLGQEIRKFRIGEQFNGIHGIRWDGRDNFGEKAALGIYFYLMQAGNETQVKKMLFGLGSTDMNYGNITMQLTGKSLYIAKVQTIDRQMERGNNLFRVRITNSMVTQPQIYNRVFENIIIQSDTTLNFVVEVVNSWRKVLDGLTSWLRDIDFPDSLNGWAIGYDGLILHSSDAGESWQKQSSPTSESLYAVDFVDNKNGWICSTSSILKTTDGGKSWNRHIEDVGEWRFYDIRFLNDKIGFVVGGKSFFGLNGILLKTTDGGETWQDVRPESLPILTHISIVDEENIWICGYGTTILFTSDLGASWTKKKLNTNVSWFTTIQFVDQYNGWVGADNNDSYGFFRTTDGGNTWQQIKNEIYWVNGVQAIFFVDQLNGWLAPVLGFGFTAINSTTDGGLTWETLSENMNLSRIYSFSFLNKDLGWAVGVGSKDSKPVGVILKYKRK